MDDVELSEEEIEEHLRPAGNVHVGHFVCSKCGARECDCGWSKFWRDEDWQADIPRREPMEPADG